MIISLGTKCQPRQTVEAVAVLAGQTVVGQTDETAGQTSHTIGNKIGIIQQRGTQMMLQEDKQSKLHWNSHSMERLYVKKEVLLWLEKQTKTRLKVIRSLS